MPIAAGFMAVLFVATMVTGIVRQYPTYSNGWANLRAFTGGCGLADDVLVEPDANAGFMAALPGNYGALGPLGGVNPVGFTPDGVPEHTVAEAIREHPLPKPGTDYDWDARPGCKPRHQRFSGAVAVRPRPGPRSAGRQLHHRPATTEPAHLGVVSAAGTRQGPSAGGGHRGGKDHRQQRAARAYHRADGGVGAGQTRP
ncbi:mycobacterial cell wall arabinan synthesis family protein [Mycobacterium xenopi 4042]|uniref:Mycobacterial cell wall arabinan synthesis family protein n=1 Tax=Mycobacterium xenopi 4042 TaxID=1299334 RepID=X8DKZ2_MYCXE|nr:mycobacterial cell wall arabinan synthesis family protein [Mycobacterium xenopi 4042]